MVPTWKSPKSTRGVSSMVKPKGQANWSMRLGLQVFRALREDLADVEDTSTVGARTRHAWKVASGTKTTFEQNPPAWSCSHAHGPKPHEEHLIKSRSQPPSNPQFQGPGTTRNKRPGNWGNRSETKSDSSTYLGCLRIFAIHKWEKSDRLNQMVAEADNLHKNMIFAYLRSIREKHPKWVHPSLENKTCWPRPKILNPWDFFKD